MDILAHKLRFVITKIIRQNAKIKRRRLYALRRYSDHIKKLYLSGS